MREAMIYMYDNYAGLLSQDEEGYHFVYDGDYLISSHSKAVSLTLPLQENAYHSNTMFSFFDGLIPEGWLLYIAEKNWKLNTRDRMGLLMTCCLDCIGAVSVRPVNPEEI